MDSRRAATKLNLVYATADFRDRDRLVAQIESRSERSVIVEGDAGETGECGQLVDMKDARVVEGQDVVATIASQPVARVQRRRGRIDRVVAARPDNRVVASRQFIVSQNPLSNSGQ